MIHFIKRIFFLGSVIIGAAFFSLPSYGSSIGVEPLFMEVSPGQSAALRVRNSSDELSTVELLVYERIVDENGVQSRVPADDDFILFPPQGVLQPQSVQVFRLQPIAADLSESKSYFISVRQVPVELEELPDGGIQLQVVFAFDAAVHVTPRGAEAEPVVISAALGETSINVETGEFRFLDDGSSQPITESRVVPAAVLKLQNDGNRYFYLQDQDYIIEGDGPGGETVKFPRWDVKTILDSVGVVLVAPGATREIKLPLDAPIAATNLRVKIRPRQKA